MIVLNRYTIFIYPLFTLLLSCLVIAAWMYTLNVYADSPHLKIPIQKYKGKHYISLHDLQRTTSLESTYDFILQRGKIYHGNSYVVYQPGLSIAVINGMLIRMDYPVQRVKGEVLLPLQLSGNVLSRFYPEYRVSMKFPFLSMVKTQQEQRDPFEKKREIPRHTSKDAIKFIIIDAGHGGKDPGAIGKGNVREKVINLKLARMVRSELGRRLKGTRIIMTRNSDKFIELGKRTEIANRQLKNGVNGVFVSIHVNASVSHKISGFETYFLSQNPTNEEARATAALENNVVILEDENRRKQYKDADFIEALMITTQIQKESSMLAESIQKHMDNLVWEFKSRGVKKADFFVLRGALMPSVLVEAGYVTHHKERTYLLKSSYQKKIARGIAQGIVNFIDTYNREIIKEN